MLASLPDPRLIDPTSVPVLRWGVIGAGGIVRSFTSALLRQTPQQVVAVAARDRRRTRAFADSAGIARSMTPDELVQDPAIDAVYIGTPHISHRDLALLAIHAGKNVLVEKPLAMTAAEGAEIAAAARAAGVLVMEAMWTRYLPQTDVIRQVLDRGDLGTVEHVEADFGFRVPFDPGHRLWNPALGGGALSDMGVYPLSFASSVLGPPDHVTAVGTVATTGVDARAVVQLSTASGATAHLHTSLTSCTPCRAVIEGTQARIEVMRYFHAPSGLAMLAGDETVEWRDTLLPDPVDGLSYQATAFASYVGEGRTESPLHGLEETVAVLATIDEARRQVLSAAKRAFEALEDQPFSSAISPRTPSTTNS